MPSPKIDWTEKGHDRMDAARRLFEAGAPIHAIAAATGLTEPAIHRYARDGKWFAPEALQSLYSEVVERAVVKKEKQAREETALLVTEDEAEHLIEELGASDVTLPERAAQYQSLMSRVSMRVAIMHLRMTDQALLDNAEKLWKLDAIARRTLKLDAPVNVPTSGKGGGNTVVNVMSSVNTLPPALTSEAAMRLEQERVAFNNGALPPVIEGSFTKA